MVVVLIAYGMAIVFLLSALGLSTIGLFFNPQALLLVLGLTIAVSVLHFGPQMLLEMLRMLYKVIVQIPPTPHEVIDILVELAVETRKRGIQNLEPGETAFPLLDKGVRLMIDGTEPNVTEEILRTETNYILNARKNQEKVLREMSIYSPLFGMIGTLIGLILMLRGLSDPSTIGPGMSIALVTTFYGSLLAGTIFMPLAGKIKGYAEIEALTNEVIIEGLRAIQAGDNSRIVREKLEAYVAA